MDDKEMMLPLGSIVVLNNGQRKLMIIGRKQIKKDTNEMYDYLGCLYPEGLLNSNFLFNNEDIKEEVFIGYSDDEEVKYKDELEILINRKNKK